MIKISNVPEQKKKILSTTQVIILGFLFIVLFGAAILTLPIAAADGHATPFIDALFTATTSVCVTGLVTVPTAIHWSLFGKVVILVLIQIGGLGVVAMTMLILMMLGKKLSLGYRKLIGDSFNLDTLSGIAVFLKKVVLGTFIVEGIGAFGYAPVFIRDYGIIQGIWYSIFHAISAFCNAGIDILGENSLVPYVHHVWVNFVTMFLIIVGGIGFIVWWDVANVLRYKYGKHNHEKVGRSHLSLHSKVVLKMTASLIIAGAVLYLVFEFHNSDTIGTFTLPQKILACLFQSVTTRTAGFASISQKGLTAPSVLVTVVLMFIGGSSVGTAGGVKTGTIAVLCIAVLSTVRGQNDVTAHRRRISETTVRKALSVVMISGIVSIIALMIMYLFVNGSAIDILFEVYSALGTAGLSRDFTASMNLIGKIIICICMFLGRIGPMSMVLAFTMKNTQGAVRYVEEDITVG